MVTRAWLLRIMTQTTFRKVWQKLEIRSEPEFFGAVDKRKRGPALEGLGYRQASTQREQPETTCPIRDRKWEICPREGKCLIIGSETPDQTKMSNNKCFGLD